MNNSNTPYSNLDPHLILDAVESLGFRCSGGLLALNSYENRVYQIGMDEGPPLIAKFYRPNRWSIEAILEEHQFALELNEHEIPVVAPLSIGGKTLHEFKEFLFAVFPRQGGRALEFDNLDHLEWMGRFIGRLHAVGALKPFQHRIQLNVDTYGHKPYQFLLENNFIPDEMRHNYCLAMDTLLEKIEENFKLVGTVPMLRLHGDCHAGNILWNDAGPWIVDLDDCLMGPAIQDIWMLLTAKEKPELKIQLNAILDGYEEFYDFNYRELHLVEALRSLRMIHYSGWLARRWEDPSFPRAFPWFNTARYWQEQLQDLREQAAVLEQVNEDMSELDLD